MIVIQDKSYVTPREAAQMFAIHLATVYNWCIREQVELLDATTVAEARESKYLIELDSLRLRHAQVFLSE